MLSVALALAAAAIYGLSDFLGGAVSRRASVWAVAIASQVGALVVIGIAAFVLPGQPTAADLAWGALAGIGTGSGTAFLYRGLAEGRMGVVAPISAVGAALVPVAVGVATGDRPAPMTWVGIACAIPAIWLVSSGEPVAARAGSRMDAGVVDGILAGLAFGMMFSALGQVPDSAGLPPLVGSEVVSVIAVAALATTMGHAWVPREPAAAWGLGVGSLSALAAVLFLFSTQSGMLTVAAVLSSLYPVFTVILAATVLRERIHGLQAVGLGLAGIAVVLVAAG